jgi:hypothetical protein
VKERSSVHASRQKYIPNAALLSILSFFDGYTILAFTHIDPAEYVMRVLQPIEVDVVVRWTLLALAVYL